MSTRAGCVAHITDLERDAGWSQLRSFGVDPTMNLGSVIRGVETGVYVHLMLDAITHADARPWSLLGG